MTSRPSRSISHCASAIRGDGQVARRLFDECEGLYAAPRWIERYGMPRRPDDLAGRPGIVCGPDAVAPPVRHWTIIRDDRTVEIAVAVAVQINDPLAARMAPEQGIGVVKLPRFIADMRCEAGLLVRLLPEWSGEMITVRAILPHRPTAAARAARSSGARRRSPPHPLNSPHGGSARLNCLNLSHVATRKFLRKATLRKLRRILRHPGQGLTLPPAPGHTAA